MIFKQPRHKDFDYTPRYYQPEKDPEVQRRDRLRFPRAQRHQTSIYRYVIGVVLLLLLISWVLKKLEIYF